MFENMMSLELKEAVYANSVPVWVAKERAYSVIVIRISGTGVYGFDDKEITVGPGEGIFFPKGSTDTFRLLSENGRYVRIHFSFRVPIPRSDIFHTIHPQYILRYRHSSRRIRG